MERMILGRRLARLQPPNDEGPTRELTVASLTFKFDGGFSIR